MSRTLSLVVLVISAVGSARAQDAAFGLPEAERNALAEALQAINLAPADLAYRKGPLEDAYRLPLIHALLHDPLSIPEATNELLAPARSAALPSALLARVIARMQGGVGLGFEPLPAGTTDLVLEDCPAKLVSLAKAFVSACEAAHDERELAFAALSAEDRALLERHALALAVEEAEVGLGLPPDLEKEPTPLWRALDRVEWAHVWRAGLHVMLAVETLSAELAADPTLAAALPLRLATRAGTVVLSGAGDDRHTEPAFAIVDVGGDDVYAGEATGAWIADLGGRDTYRGGSRSLGAGILDVRVVWDRAGDDDYSGEAATQGFGAFGIGLLVDEGGNDRYRAWLYAQGASRTWGAGVLADRAGDDCYQAGGKVIHKPLLEKERATFGLSQGFSIGYRPDRSGGIGVLWDGAGDDAYVGGTYTQGASYWFALGVLADDRGNDRYTAFYYSQASAMHLTVAALLDREGHDLYAAHMGAIHAIGHDWGVALLWDGGGNDVYAGDSAPGVGVANGIGIFIDSAGDDRYGGSPASANPARDSGSVAIFLDLGGRDRYGRGLADGGLALRRAWGVARDVPDPPTPVTPPGVAPPHPIEPHAPPGSVACPEPAELERVYAEAALWAVGSTRDKAWAARRALVEFGVPAARWIVDHKLAKAQSLEQEAIVAVFRAIGPTAGELLVAALDVADAPTRAVALRLVATLEVAAAGPAVRRLLQTDEPNRRYAIAAAGAIRSVESVPALVVRLPDGAPFERLAIVLALGKIGDKAAVEPLIGALLDTELPVRQAAADALVKLGPPGAGRLRELVGAGPTALRRLAMEALGRLDTAEDVGRLAELARDADWGVRLTALISLKRMKAEGAVAAYEAALAAESDPRVKAAIARSDPDAEPW